MDLFADYCAAIDAGDLDAYVDNFLPSVIDYDGTTTYAGREAIREFVGGLFAGGRVGAEPAFIRHFVGLPHVWGDGERAHARTYVIIFTQDKDRNVAIPSVGSYTDTCVRWTAAGCSRSASSTPTSATSPRREIRLRLVAP